MRSDEGWQTSSWSDSGGQCVAVYRDRSAIRDSKNPDGPRIVATPAAVAELVEWIKTAR
jgi:Domain of unknown function (DUF397)